MSKKLDTNQNHNPQGNGGTGHQTQATGKSKDTGGGCSVSKLKPCPFCGHKENDLRGPFLGSNPLGHYRVKCNYCSVIMEQDRKDKAIGMWNTRA